MWWADQHAWTQREERSRQKAAHADALLRKHGLKYSDMVPLELEEDGSWTPVLAVDQHTDDCCEHYLHRPTNKHFVRCMCHDEWSEGSSCAIDSASDPDD
jgi:hypothetical protein